MRLTLIYAEKTRIGGLVMFYYWAGGIAFLFYHSNP